MVDFWWDKIETPPFECGYYSNPFYISVDGLYHKIYWYQNNYHSTIPTKNYESLEDFKKSSYSRTPVNVEYVKDKQFVKPIFILENGKEIEDVK